MEKETTSILGTDLFGEPIRPNGAGKLKVEFIMPPFSVLNARDGVWQERKRAWLSLGIQSELGRGEKASIGEPPMPLDRPQPFARSNGQDLMKGENPKFGKQELGDIKGGITYSGPVAGLDYYRVKEGTRESTDVKGTSIFDPVLCELMYKWFCLECSQVIDPFAGGSVRGIVAAFLGHKYWGCDLSEPQIKANKLQGLQIVPNNQPVWLAADALDVLLNAPNADFVFSCPPYGDLERYSDDPRDLSTMEYHTFVATYKRIIMRACAKLKDNRFACFVVGDFRDKRTGHYRNFISHTIDAFLEQGLHLYNEAILVTAVGSLPIRISKQFVSGRKLGKTHQNILIFYKGNPKAIKREFGQH